MGDYERMVQRIGDLKAEVEELKAAAKCCANFPRATGLAAEDGWTLDWKFLELVKFLAAESEQVSMEQVQAVLLAAEMAVLAQGENVTVTMLDQIEGEHNESIRI